MKKTITLITCMLISSIMIPAYALATAQWTILVYLDADNDLEPDGIDDFLEMATVGSDENINYVVQMDRIDGEVSSYENWTDCKRFHIQKDMTPIARHAVENLGEVNMADPETLKNFIQWGITNYPAQHYALVLWDHGDGWHRKRSKKPAVKGICFDDTSGYDASLSMADVKNVLTELPVKPDLVGFDACLMGMLENAYMLKKAGISVMVGSEDLEPAPGWPYDRIAQELASHPEWEASQLGECIVEQYYLSYDMSETQSAIDLSKIDPLIDSLSEFATSLRSLWQGNTQGIQNAAQTLRNRIDDAVISVKYGNLYRGTGGLAIYFPDYYYDDAYDQTDLAKDTFWNDFLIDYHEFMVSSWITNIRNQLITFDYENIDLYQFCTKLESTNPDDLRPHYVVQETPYAFEDIQSSGHMESISDSTTLKINPADFSFHFHDETYNTFIISDDGAIYFNDADFLSSYNTKIPTYECNALIAPFWDDYDDATVYWTIKNTDTTKKLIIQWQDVMRYFSDDGDSPVTFQAILFENGRIMFQYKDTDFNNSAYDYGGSATVGIQESATVGIQYTFDEPKIQSPFALLFEPENETGCFYSLASYHLNIDSQGESRTLALMTDDDCEWTVVSKASWIHILSPKSGTGDTQIKYEVSENTTLFSRTGKIQVADQTITIIQSSPCEFEINPLKQGAPAAGGIGQITITASLPDCPWVIEITDNWISPLQSQGEGSGVFSYSVTKNMFMNKRTGEIHINGKIITVIQEAADAPEVMLLDNHDVVKNLSLDLGQKLYYKIEIPEDHYSFQITTTGETGDCDVFVRYSDFPTDDYYDESSSNGSNAESIFIPEPQMGTWYIMLYAYKAFENVQLRVDYESYRCDYIFSDTTFRFSSEAVSSSFTLTTGDACQWTIDTFEPWIEIINNPQAHQGSAVIDFKLTENTSILDRNGVIFIANQFIEIFQEGNLDIEISLLENGIPKEQISGDYNSLHYYKLIVPENQLELEIKTWGGTGDCDLFVGYDAFPIPSDYYESSESYDNDEIISISDPQPGEYYILIFGYEEFDNVNLKADFRDTVCTYTLSQTNIFLDQSASSVNIELVTEPGCSWNVVSFDSWITIETNSSSGSGSITINFEENIYSSPRMAFVEIADQLIDIHQVSNTENSELENNVPVTGLSVNAYQQISFFIDVPANQKSLVINSWNGTGDVDLYANFGMLPFYGEDYLSAEPGNDESIMIKNPDEGRWFILLEGNEDSYDVSLSASYSSQDCNYQITPMQATFDASGGIGNLSIITNDSCSWTANQFSSWIEIDDTTRRGTGNGHVRYTVTTNENSKFRAHNILVADQWVIVMQSGTVEQSPMLILPETPVTVSGDEDTTQYFQINISEPTHLNFMTSDGYGDCDLYISHGMLPTLWSYDFRPYENGNDETVFIEYATPGIWYAMIHGYSSFSDAQFQITYARENTDDKLVDLIQILQILAGTYAWVDSEIDYNLNGIIGLDDALMIFRMFE